MKVASSSRTLIVAQRGRESHAQTRTLAEYTIGFSRYTALRAQERQQQEQEREAERRQRRERDRIVCFERPAVRESPGA